MSIELFQQKFTDYFACSKNAYQFLTPKLEPKDLKWPQADQIKSIIYQENTAGYPEIRGIARFLGVASTPPDSTVREKLMTTLQEMQKYGISVGFSLKDGAPKILLAVDAENLNDEQIVGRFILIRDTTQKFKDFALPPLLGVRGRWTKCPTKCYVFTLFLSHAKALHFTENLQEKSKHNPVFSKAAHVLPWAVDLERKRVKKYSGLGRRFLPCPTGQKNWEKNCRAIHFYFLVD
jgi:hypothetical protein